MPPAWRSLDTFNSASTGDDSASFPAVGEWACRAIAVNPTIATRWDMLGSKSILNTTVSGIGDVAVSC
jgi:hypothetical protein